MRLHRIGLVALLGVAAIAGPVCAADPVAGTTPIKGSDAMGDKGRSGPDGWSWAPQTRDQAPADTANKTAANGRGSLNSQPTPDAGKKLSPGDDPGTPATAEGHGPGTMDSGAPHKP